LLAHQTEIEIEDLLLISHLGLDHLCNLSQIAINGGLYVEFSTLDSVNMIFNSLHSVHAFSESYITPPSLQAVGGPLLKQFLNWVEMNKSLSLSSQEHSLSKEMRPPVPLNYCCS